jgi:hypothetical protein
MTERPTDRKLPGAVLAELLGASKTYGTGATAVRAVEDVDLTVRAGSCWRCWAPTVRARRPRWAC